MTISKRLFWAGLLASTTLLTQAAETESGFTSLFDGQTLSGWKLMGKHGEGYGVKDGVIYCARGGGGNLFTEKEYGNFIFRVEFKLEEVADGTLLTVVESGFDRIPAERRAEAYRMNSQGWATQMENVQRHVEG